MTQLETSIDQEAKIQLNTEQDDIDFKTKIVEFQWELISLVKNCGDNHVSIKNFLKKKF